MVAKRGFWSGEGKATGAECVFVSETHLWLGLYNKFDVFNADFVKKIDDGPHFPFDVVAQDPWRASDQRRDFTNLKPDVFTEEGKVFTNSFGVEFDDAGKAKDEVTELFFVATGVEQ